MKLVGRYLSPFVRRVATTLNLYGMPFEHIPMQHSGDDAPKLRQLNPVGRVPALVLANDRVIIDSAAILDYLDRQAGPERSLTPVDGEARDDVLSLTALAAGTVEKAIATVYEKRFRPEEKWHAPWVDRCSEQARGGFEHLDSLLSGDWLVGDQMTQADVTTAISWQFTQIANPALAQSINAPKIAALAERLGEMEAFKSTYPG